MEDRSVSRGWARSLLDEYRSSPASVCAALGCSGALFFLFSLWLRGDHGYGLPSKLAAALSMLAFWALGLSFLPQWVRSWSLGDARSVPEPAPRAESSTAVAVFLAFLLYDLCLLCLAYLALRVCGGSGGLKENLKLWNVGDGRHYLYLAENGYLSQGDADKVVLLVFLPGYPLLVRLVNGLVGNYLYSGLLSSGLCFALSGAVLYRLMRLDLDRETALRALRWLCLMPGAFFFAAPMSESLFLLLSAACVYFMRRERWGLSCLMGGLAAFTRSVGLVLMAPVLFELMADVGARLRAGRRPALGRCLWPLLILSGFALYCLLNYRVSGDPFRFMAYQKEHWNQTLGWFFNTAAYQMQYLLEALRAGSVEYAAGLWLPGLLCPFLSLLLMARSAGRLRPGYTALFIAYYTVAMGTTWLLSAPRYLLVMFPLPMALAVLTRRRGTDCVLTAITLACSLAYLFMFIKRWQVW